MGERSIPQQSADPLAAIPDAATIRQRIEQNRREYRLLKQLLKLATDRVRPEAVAR